MKFDPLKDDYSQPKAEDSVLKFWDDQQVFHKAQAAA